MAMLPSDTRIRQFTEKSGCTTITVFNLALHWGRATQQAQRGGAISQMDM